MKVYLASAYESRDEIAALVPELTRIGFTSTARWLKQAEPITAGTSGAAPDIDGAQVGKHVLDDFEDIRAADVLVLFTRSASGFAGGGGRHVETGYALANRKRVIVIGEPESVFHRGAPLCTVVQDWHEAVLELVALREALPQAVAS